MLTPLVFLDHRCPTPGCDGSGHKSGLFASHRRSDSIVHHQNVVTVNLKWCDFITTSSTRYFVEGDWSQELGGNGDRAVGQGRDERLVRNQNQNLATLPNILTIGKTQYTVLECKM